MVSGAETAAKKVGFPLGFGILVAPLIFTWFLLRPGYATSARVIGFLWLGISALVIIGVATSPPVSEKPMAAEPSVERPATSSFYKIDAEKYGRISSGMSYEQVKTIIGDPGEESSSSDLGGTRTVAYTWKNFDGSNALLMFQDDRLISKAQYGLR